MTPRQKLAYIEETLHDLDALTVTLAAYINDIDEELWQYEDLQES